ncbi:MULTISPECIES: DNA-processing protein DprA [Rhodanobacter]|uniref:DNA-processing protein DprA n=1 Tax=Rhodanobacter TaxID=75309 RepID=UPI0004154279|nr:MULTISPECIES: DNA-processing protein DprA [Rhodanobacter]KZC18561.1 DNA processing protein DprA [Rhodanobacter denitrificans]UJJ50831.1 DNA-processing protein DprA [Rhodanobacter denitrificans]UJJ56969.1 DNA-processing protein DprA [Rhodanobacter denitrificans]UJM93546.1 DNA-processing protein DprA [Rhodanobacter denitrificans]UJM97077.1 DNA-processing protein DprA [Rhodanobacter denitrificans]
MTMDDRDELRAWLLALRTPGLGPGGLRERLDAAGGDIRAALAQLSRDAARLGEPARAWLARPDEVQLAADLAWLAEPGHRLLRCTEVDFPPQLEHIPQPPAVLFVVGDTGLLLYPQVAIVGARGASAVGLAHARAFALALTEAGFAITSGMADGIDGAAHVAALDAGAKTLAVVGTGPDRVYPRKHHALARRLAAQGALVSEFPPGTPARPDHFPRRNRIIAGLALGTLVVEAGLRSGSLITARLAAEQGREVFALPGSIHHPLARGCHRLIRDGARLVESATEIVETLTPAARMLGGELAARLGATGGAVAGPPRVASDDGVAPGLAEADGDTGYRRLLTELGHEPATLDELVQRTGRSAAALSSMLMILELEARVASLPGNRYQRLPGG